MISSTLFKIINSVCPIEGLSIGDVNDKLTWRIDFRDGATDKQRQDAKDVIATFDAVAELAKSPPKSEIELLEERITALEAKVK